MQGTPEPPQPQLHDWNILPKKRKKSLPKICKKESENTSDSFFNGVTWTVWDLAKAGSLLSNPPKNVIFEDEQEMRVVYSLIYDVYRCKWQRVQIAPTYPIIKRKNSFCHLTSHRILVFLAKQFIYFYILWSLLKNSVLDFIVFHEMFEDFRIFLNVFTYFCG